MRFCHSMEFFIWKKKKWWPIEGARLDGLKLFHEIKVSKEMNKFDLQNVSLEIIRINSTEGAVPN